jgi:uncharacterized glyoxalase superfamily protein PhnB
MDKNIIEPRYVLAVNDLEKSIEYYESALRFEIVNRFPGWAFLSRDSFLVMLGECSEEKAAHKIGDHSYFAYLVVNDAKSLFDEFKGNNVKFVKQLKDEPWGMREFGIVTIDGHRMMFGEKGEWDVQV